MPAFRGTEAFAAQLAQERTKWRRVIREAGITAD